MAGPRIRSLTLQDLERILEIDERVTKVPRRGADNDLWRLIAETTTCFGAESDGRLVGFVLADVRPWEFGNRAHVGWIIMLGVDPAHQKKGVGRLLGERVLDEFKRQGVAEFKTLVDEGDDGLRKYFESLGFRPAREVVLRMGDGARRGKAKPRRKRAPAVRSRTKPRTTRGPRSR
jgi:GNAT superfamily N-acetyltransferase